MIHKVQVYCNRKSFFIQPEEIVFIKAFGSYTFISMMSGELIKLSKNMTTTLSILSFPDYLIRVHKSYCFNIKHVDYLYYKQRNKLFAIMRNRSEIPITQFTMKSLGKLMDVKFYSVQE